jgi:hypothetical protein
VVVVGRVPRTHHRTTKATLGNSAAEEAGHDASRRAGLAAEGLNARVFALFSTTATALTTLRCTAVVRARSLARPPCSTFSNASIANGTIRWGGKQSLTDFGIFLYFFFSKKQIRVENEVMSTLGDQFRAFTSQPYHKQAVAFLNAVRSLNRSTVDTRRRC